MYIVIVILGNGRAHIVERDGTGAALRLSAKSAEACVNGYIDRGDFAMAYRV